MRSFSDHCLDGLEVDRDLGVRVLVEHRVREAAHAERVHL